MDGCLTALGVGRLLGLESVRGPGMTGNLGTNLDAKFHAAAELLQEPQGPPEALQEPQGLPQQVALTQPQVVQAAPTDQAAELLREVP